MHKNAAKLPNPKAKTARGYDARFCVWTPEGRRLWKKENDEGGEKFTILNLKSGFRD
jgi:hypothetical protein